MREMRNETRGVVRYLFIMFEERKVKKNFLD